jgi:hypothetical protein
LTPEMQKVAQTIWKNVQDRRTQKQAAAKK